MSAATVRHLLPPVACHPWCVYQDGHPNEVHRDDQWCGTEYVEIPTRAYPSVEQQDQTHAPAAIAVYGTAWHHGAVPKVHVGLGDDRGLDILPAEARELAAQLLRIADVVEPQGEVA
jgi:hypothetical protein